MKWHSIVVKLGASILLLVLAILLPLGFIMNQIFSGFYFSKVQEQIDDLSSRYAESINTLDSQHLNMFEQLATLTGQEIIIVNKEGVVVANSGIPSLPKGEKINSKEFDLLSINKATQKEYYDEINNRRYLSVGKPIYTDRVIIGGIFVLASIEDMYQSVDMIEKSVTLAGIGAIFLALGFIFILSRKLSNPLLEMEKATRKIAKGDLNTRVSKGTKDEVGSLAAAINDLALELQRYRSNRREFFANISHELRTPITYLEGYAHALENNLYQSDEEKEQYLQIIQQEASRLSKLVADLFELSKMEEGKIDLHFESVDLVEVVENALLKTTIKAKEKGLQIDFNRLTNIPSIYADGLRMEQIVLNLIENSIRYTEKGTISVKLSKELNSIILAVEDTGIGIPEEDVPFLFERFYRVEKSRSRDFGGTGLGLAIVKQLVELQGGAITVKSKMRKGTCFELTFPINRGDVQ